MIVHLTKLVPELLYLHNCVIIPGFGGFVATSVPSHLQEDRSTIHPPSKRIAFNQNLRDNDGLLGYALSQKLGIGYDDAMRKVYDEIDLLRKHLENYRNFEFKNTGTFYLNTDNKLLFVPYLNQNFLLESYGFAALKVRPILKDLAGHPKQKQIHKPAISLGSQSDGSVSKKSRKMGWIPAIAASITLLAAAAFVMNEWHRSEKSPVSDAFANMTILPDSPMGETSDLDIIDEFFTAPDQSNSGVLVETEAMTEETAEVSDKANESIKNNSNKKSASDDVKSSEEAPKDLTATPEKQSSNTRALSSGAHQIAYAVVCLETKNEKEAKKLLHRLESRQYEAGILTEIKQGWYVVYAQKLYTRQAARRFASMVEKNERLNTEIVEHIIP